MTTPQNASVLQVVILREGSLVGTEVFLPGAYTVGRAEGCELRLDDLAVESLHAVLEFRDNQIFLEDTSGGEVRVNGQSISKIEVRSLDDVEVGPFVLKFRVVGPKRTTARSENTNPTGVVSTGRAGSPERRSEAAAVRRDRPAARRDEPDALAGAGIAASAEDDEATRATDPQAAMAGRAASAAERRPAAVPQHTVRIVRPIGALAQPAQLVQPPGPGAPLPSGRVRRSLTPNARPAAGHDEDPLAKVDVTERHELPVVEPLVPRQARKLEADPRVALDRTLAPDEPAAPASAAGRHDVSEDQATVAYTLRGSRARTEPEGASAVRGGAGLPYLRVRVLWGKTVVGLHGFPYGTSVAAAPRERCDVPLYGLELPERTFKIARCRKGGWFARVPAGYAAFWRGASSRWEQAQGELDRKQTLTVPLPHGGTLRFGNATHSVELRVEVPHREPAAPWRQRVDLQLAVPLAATALLMGLAVLLMPAAKKDVPDFSPSQLSHARALLKPPPVKKKPPKKKEELAEAPEKKARQERKKEDEPAAPKVATKATVNQAIKAVQKLTSAGPAVESLLKATAKLAGGPKGYGDKGMGYKISPLIGKPPIAMAGIAVGQGLGGFGTETKGFGSLRGMGAGGGGIGTFAAGGTGKGKVAGMVVSAPSRQAQVRGSLDRELIAKVINEHMTEVRGCYERALLKDPNVAGKLQLEWTIDTSGRVSAVKIKSVSLRSPEVPGCIVSSLKGWTFPKPRGGKVVVSYPFIFNSVGF